MRGAVVSGKQVITNIGGDFNLESLQDTNTYKVDEKSLGIGISLCIPPFCYGMSSISGASPNFGATNIYSNYASQAQQYAQYGISGIPGMMDYSTVPSEQKYNGEDAEGKGTKDKEKKGVA